MAKIKDAREAAMVGRRSDGTLTRRPLSPHLQVYDMMQMTSLLSILHRISGVAWCGGLVLLVWWLVAAGTGQSAFATADVIFSTSNGTLYFGHQRRKFLRLRFGELQLERSRV